MVVMVCSPNTKNRAPPVLPDETIIEYIRSMYRTMNQQHASFEGTTFHLPLISLGILESSS